MNSKPKNTNLHISQSLRHQTPLEGGAEWLRKNIPQTNLNWKELLNCSSNLQVTISRVGVSVSVSFLKGTSGLLIRTCLPVSPLYFLLFSFRFFFLCKRARTNSYLKPLHLYLTISERKFYRKVYNIFSEDRHRKANDNLFRYKQL